MNINSLSIISGSIKDLDIPALSDVEDNSKKNLLALDHSSGSTTLKIKTDIIPPSGPDFWMYKGLNFKGMFPLVSDASSSGSGSYLFNFGQLPFKGDPLGYDPYDTDYSRSKWEGPVSLGSAPDSLISPNNLRFGTYTKSYTTGKKYFEISIYGNPHADHIGLVEYASNNYLFSMSYNQIKRIMVQVGTHNTPSVKSGGGAADWYDYFDDGQTLQVWLDFDEGNMLFKRLGTDISDYISPII